MAKTKILVLVKANPSPFAKEVLQYQEKLIRESCIIQKIRARSIDQIMIISKNIISSDISVCNDFEYFCNHYGVDLIELSSLFQVMNEIIRILR